jgi:peptidylprolyl isomerase domain and WD repeat-containing protein 1
MKRPLENDDDSSDDDYGPPRPPPQVASVQQQQSANEDDDDEEDYGPKRPTTTIATTVSDDDEDDYGPPRPSSSSIEQPPTKKQKLDSQLQSIFLDQLPSAHMYEWSYMHKTEVTHTLVTPNTHFVLTASRDGELKFWKKTIQHQLVFVKEYVAHTEPITSLSCSSDGTLLCTSSAHDQTIKVFDVVTFDMINVLNFRTIENETFKPYLCEFISQKHASAKRTLLAVCDNIINEIRIYDLSDGDTDLKEPLYTYRSIHSNLDGNRIFIMKFNESFNTMVTIDKKGIIEYWDINTGKFPTSGLSFQYKSETNLYEFAMKKTFALALSFSKDGKQFATMGRDRFVRVFNFETGKLIKTYNETLSETTKLQQSQSEFTVEPIDFGRRMADEKELEKLLDLVYENPHHKLIQPVSNVLFDDSGNYLIYPTLLGIKIVNLKTDKVERLLGKVESTERFLAVSLFQGTIKISRAELIRISKDAKVENTDPTVVCCAFKKKRFFTFSKREPSEEESVTGRDIFNEKPSREEMEVAALNVPSQHSMKGKLAKAATIHTTFGDLQLKLFPDQCPKTVENFTRLSQEGYYNGIIFHRIIKGFMVQTGDPEGDGTGGSSCWGRDFEDEFHPMLRHDKPFKLSMANCGPNTNGSQFFITVAPTPWLDNKHTLFGEVTRGQDVVQMIEQVRTDRTDKPFEKIQIINVDLQL